MVAFHTFQGYRRRELWDDQAWRHLAASGHSMPASWSLQVHSLSLPGPAAHAPAVPDGSDGSSPASPTADGGSAHGGQQLWVHMPEGSYRWEHVADCPVYVRWEPAWPQSALWCHPSARRQQRTARCRRCSACSGRKPWAPLLLARSSSQEAPFFPADMLPASLLPVATHLPLSAPAAWQRHRHTPSCTGRACSLSQSGSWQWTAR